MPAFSFEKMPDIVGMINVLVAQCVSGINEVREAYDSMRIDIEQSIEETRQHIGTEINNIQARRDAHLDQLFGKIKEYVRYIKELNDSARDRSKAYQKTCVEFEQDQIEQPQYSIETIDQCQIKLCELSEKAKKAYELIVNSSGVGGLIGTFSGEMKKSHIELISACRSSLDILRHAEYLMTTAKRNASAFDEKVADERLAGAEDECRLLCNQIAQRENEDIANYLETLRKQLCELIPMDTVADLTELSSLVNPYEGSEPQGLCQQLKLGTYRCTVDGWPFIGAQAGIDQVLLEHFGSWYNSGHINAPALVDRAESASVIICGSADATSGMLNWLATSELETNQAPNQTFIFINPSGDRQVFEPYLAAIKECREVFGEGVLTDSRSLTEVLKKAVDTINDRSQRLLVGYRNIFDFNEDDETAELPLITLCMSTSFEDLSKQSREDIKCIVRNGPFCGVNLFLAVDVSEVNIDDITGFLSGCRKALIGWASKDDCSVEVSDGVRIDFERIGWKRVSVDLARVIDQVKSHLEQSIGIKSVFPTDAWFEGSTLEGLSIPMGKAPDGRCVTLDFGPKVSNGISHFGLMIGAAGSGKSSLLHSLIISALLKYGPDELLLYLLDFKSGVEFELYSRYRIPQLRLIALDAMQVFGLSILQELMQQMDERNRLFKNAAVENIEEYRLKTGNPMPRILVVMDEFQSLFNEDHDKRAARESATLLADFISLARNCGIHFLLSTQTLSRLRTGNFSLSQSTLDEMHVRIGLQCSLNEAEKLFGEIYGKQAYELMGAQKGSGVFTENDLKLPPEAFRATFCDKDDRSLLLKSIEERYAAINPLKGTRVFRSDTIPDILDGMKRSKESAAELSRIAPIYLGEPIKIGDPIVLNVNRRIRSTLLIAGGNGNTLDTLIGDYVYSALTAKDMLVESGEFQASFGQPTVYLCEGRFMVGEPGSGPAIRVCSGRYEDVKVAKRNTDFLQYIDELYLLMRERQNNPEYAMQIVHLVISEFQWIDTFHAIYERRDVQYELNTPLDKAEESDPNSVLDGILNGLTSTSPDANVSRLEKLEQLIQRGYAYGINVVIGTTDFASLRERLYDLVPNMQNRIVFSLNEDDAERLVHGVLGQMETLGSNMAIFSDGRNVPEVFMPYRISTI